MRALALAMLLAGCAHGPRVLLVLAHPDDETMMGGVLGRLVDAHARVDAVYVTDGEGGRNVLGAAPPPRLAELSRALAWYHVHLLAQLHAPDVALRDAAGKPTRDPSPFVDGVVWAADLQRRLPRVMRAHHYDLVLTLVPDGVVHAHHQAVGRMAQAIDVAPTYGVLERGWYPDEALGGWQVECRTDVDSPALHSTYRDFAAEGATRHASQDAGHRGLGPDAERYRKLGGQRNPLERLCHPSAR